MKYPKHLYRRDDGERFSYIGSGLYWMDKSMMPKDFKEYQYPYELLMRSGFKTKLKDCVIEKYISKNDGHGDDDD